MTPRIRSLLSVSFLACCLLGTAFVPSDGATIVSGNITGTWTAEGSPYIVTADIAVVDSLIIEPGTTVQIQAGGWKIQADSGDKLSARGTAENPITFEPYSGSEPGLWQGIVLSSSSNDDNLEHCVIKNAVRGIYVSSSQPLIEYCTLSDHSEAGIYLYQSVTGTLIRDCEFYSNVYGLHFRVVDQNRSAVIDHCSYWDNERAISLYSKTTVYYKTSSAVVDVRNTTIANNAYGIFAEGTDNGYGGSTRADADVINSIVAYNSVNGFRNNNSFGKIGADNLTYNCIWDNGINFYNVRDDDVLLPGDYTNVNGDPCDVNQNIYYDPYFVDIPTRDYRLLGNSICIDAGNPVVGEVFVQDPDGTDPDMGAHFFDQGGCPQPEGFFSINSDTDVTHIRQISLASNVANAESMRFSLDNETWPDGWVPYSTYYDWTVDAVDGIQTVYAQYMSECGGLLELSDAIEVLPTFVSFFDLNPGEGEVAIDWQVSERATFLLEARNFEARWEVPYSGDGFGSYAARDRSDHLNAAGEVTYSLYVEAAGGAWELLAEDSVMMQSPARRTRLHLPYPNPFNPRTTISFECREPGDVQVAIYDLGGRVVTTLFEGWMEEGLHERVWDGTDHSGSMVSAGQYFVRLKAKNRVDVQKLVLAK